ncbi:MAG TPA: hypothetical protein VD908_00415 [Cytophagales bacterium]|nr:hypothetical protein [Cytophagales bacterium]
MTFIFKVDEDNDDKGYTYSYSPIAKKKISKKYLAAFTTNLYLFAKLKDLK